MCPFNMSVIVLPFWQVFKKLWSDRGVRQFHIYSQNEMLFKIIIWEMLWQVTLIAFYCINKQEMENSCLVKEFYIHFALWTDYMSASCISLLWNTSHLEQGIPKEITEEQFFSSSNWQKKNMLMDPENAKCHCARLLAHPQIRPTILQVFLSWRFVYSISGMQTEVWYAGAEQA